MNMVMYVYRMKYTEKTYSTEITTTFANRAKALVSALCVSIVSLINIKIYSYIWRDETYQPSPYKMHHHEKRQWLVRYHCYSTAEQF
jgi:hypothetical protein